MKTTLTIAGSDCSGGAGIQADLKTMLANGVYGMSAITALTSQNTTGVYGVMEVTPDFLASQLDSIFTDIFPDAIKIGMVSSVKLIDVICEKIKQYQGKNIVVDPVLVATSGSNLIEEESVGALAERLLPIASVITPNIPEAQTLLQLNRKKLQINDEASMEEAARFISEKYNCSVLLKGGHSVNDSNDYLFADGKGKWFLGSRIDNPNTHGTGCTLSSAIAANLAKGFSLDEAVENAKKYIEGALLAMLDLGLGSGPMNHGYMIKSR